MCVCVCVGGGGLYFYRSHLLIAGCDIGIKNSVYLSIGLSFLLSTSVTFNCSVPMTARIMKPHKVIVLDMLYKLAT